MFEVSSKIFENEVGHGYEVTIYCPQCREVVDWFDSYSEYREGFTPKECTEQITEIIEDITGGNVRTWFTPSCEHYEY